MPLHRRMPKRGFTNPFREEYSIINLAELNELEGDTFFPAWDRSQFEEINSQGLVTAAGVPYRFVTYRRRAQPT